MIKEYFANYFLHTSDVTFDMQKNEMEVHTNHAEPWKVTLVDTGLETGTAGRLKLVAPYLENEENFCFTYGDGVTNSDIRATIKQHLGAEALATVTAIQPPGRFGALDIDGNKISHFQEKPPGDETWVNGGFFVLSKKVLEYIDDTSVMWEDKPLQTLATKGQLACYKHHGFWYPMDTLRDKQHLEKLWLNDQAPWKLWA